MSAFKQLCTVPTAGACVTIFCAQSIPEKLISFHRTTLQKLTAQEYRIFILGDSDLDELFAQLSITFLGQSSVYAIKDGDISASDRKKLDTFLQKYAGPHAIYFFTHDTQYEKNALVVETVMTKKLFLELATLNNYASVAPNFVEKLFALKASYTFDESLMFITYAHLLGARSELFFSEWITRILVDDASLFTLSQYFFAQQKNLLLPYWARLKERYPAEFWISFFSEQLWQATLYNQYASKGQAVHAKRYAYRLPFSYFQKDWKRYSLTQLTQAHAFLYEIDHGLKNGYATEGLELFIHSAF